MRVYLFVAVTATLLLAPAVSQAGLFRRRDGTPREPVKTAIDAAAGHHGQGRCLGERGLGEHRHRGQCSGTFRNGPWGCRTGN